MSEIDKKLDATLGIDRPIKNLDDAKNHLTALKKLEDETTDIIERLSADDHNIHLDEDYIYVRSNLKELIDTQRAVLERMIELADESDHPRMFEVLSLMMRNMADTNKDLFLIQEKINSLKQLSANPNPPNGNGTVNQSIFVGSTKELQEFFKEQQKSNKENNQLE